MNAELLIYVTKTTNRLRYIFDLILTELLGLSFRFTNDQEQYKSYEGPKFCYGTQALDDGLFFKSAQLLFEREIDNQDLQPFVYKGLMAFFPVFHKQSALPFDLFAASFFLVSRYEEYLPFVQDSHGRFEAESSCLSEMGMLQKPLINIWSHDLMELLQTYFPRLKFRLPVYQFTPTYDIDIAWSYLHKGLYRTIGAYMRDLLAGDYTEIVARTKVLRKKTNDPYDTYSLQLDLQSRYKLYPIYFILFASYAHYDKNISRRNPAFRRLIRHLADYATIGIHPSYASTDDKTILKQEVEALSEVIHSEITHSRQHFLRVKLPTVYHWLMDMDITDDYSMGFATQPGFRAGIANSFLFYDLDHDLPTKLRVHPLIVMDGSLRDYLHIEKEAAKELITTLINEVKKAGGNFISLWHNETLSNTKRWTGWNEVYTHLIEQAIS